MKLKQLLMAALLPAFFLSAKAQNTFPSTGSAGIGTTTPNASSLLDMESTTKGLLIPRVTFAQRNSIATPATGLIVYQTNSNPGFYYYNDSAWVLVSQWLSSGTNVTYSAGDAIIHNITVGLGKGYVGTNTAVGNSALAANTTGSANTATGADALSANTTGSDNTAYGYNPLFYNSTGNQNIAIGYQPLFHNTTGGNNAATGFQALYSNTTASGNTANGYKSLFYDTTGANNTAIGAQALYSNTIGNTNTALGFNTLYKNTTGYSNVALGTAALYINQTNSNTVAIGDSALYNNTASGNTAVGSKVLYKNTIGTQNTVSGYQALYTNTSGSSNTVSGYKALYLNTTGSLNTVNGYEALYANTMGSENTALGWQALNYNTVGSHNIGIGYDAIDGNSSGNYNVGIGDQCLYFSGTGSYNTADGCGALFNTNASYNTALGYYAGANYGNSANNTFLGAQADVNGSNYTNATVVGYLAAGTASNQIRIGNSSVTSIGGYDGWTNISDGRVKTNIKQNVPGLAFIAKLQPITYNLNLDAADKIMQTTAHKDKDGKVMPLTAQETSARAAKQQVIYTGFIAQDVEAAARSLNYDFSGVDAAKNSTDLYGLRYAEFVVPLVKAVQELNDSLQKTNASLQSQINELKIMMQQLLAAKGDVVIPSQNISLTSASLQQNTPNPYNQSTTIHYSVPATFTSAQIIVTDNTGKTLKQIPVTTTGAGTVNINAGSLSAGIYNYSLIVDGAVIDTKKMVLAK